jgi:disulfide oxidoreductase YuzD
MKSFEDMTNKEIESGIRNALRKEFPNTAFRVVYNGELWVDIIGGDLMSYGDNLPESIEEKIQNAVFEVVPILMIFEDSKYI